MFEFFKSKNESKNEIDDDEVSFQIEMIKARVFPGGDKQIDLETSRLHLALKGKLTISDTRNLLIWTKIRLVLQKDDPLELISDGIFRHEEGRLSKNEAEYVLNNIAGISGALYSGGDGYSSENPVVINCSITSVGVYAERKWLTESFGAEGTHWKLKLRSHGYLPSGRAFETYVLQFPDREDVSIHFDISQWYLKN